MFILFSSWALTLFPWRGLWFWGAGGFLRENFIHRDCVEIGAHEAVHDLVLRVTLCFKETQLIAWQHHPMLPVRICLCLEVAAATILLNFLVTLDIFKATESLKYYLVVLLVNWRVRADWVAIRVSRLAYFGWFTKLSLPSFAVATELRAPKVMRNERFRRWEWTTVRVSITIAYCCSLHLSFFPYVLIAKFGLEIEFLGAILTTIIQLWKEWSSQSI